MDAANPAARSALAFLYFCDGALDVVLARGSLLYGDVPADELITGEWRETLPCVYCSGCIKQGLLEVGW